VALDEGKDGMRFDPRVELVAVGGRRGPVEKALEL
jgi:hypothetical protein